jgi:Lon protease-like protein
MEPHPLTRDAENIRKQIKEIIPETVAEQNKDARPLAELLEVDVDGNRSYGGKLLNQLIFNLTQKMKIGEVLQPTALMDGIITNAR